MRPTARLAETPNSLNDTPEHKMKKGLIALLAAVVIGLIAYTAFFNQTPAPQVAFTTLSGQSSSIEALKGKVVLVNFWATSCSGCVEEMPEIKKLHEQYASRGLQVVAVAMNYDPENYVKAFVAKNALPFMVTRDSQGNVAKAFGDIQLTPTTFIIDKQGNILKHYIGEMNFGEVRQLLNQQLKS